MLMRLWRFLYRLSYKPRWWFWLLTGPDFIRIRLEGNLDLDSILLIEERWEKTAPSVEWEERKRRVAT